MENGILTFREVHPADLPALISLMEQLGYPIEREAMRENIESYLALPTQKAWVAELKGKVVGCIAVAITQSFHRPGSFLRVIALVVNQEERRLGIGKSLMSIAEKFALDCGCTYVELTSGVHRAKLGSHQFYQSLGYIELNATKKYFVKQL